MEGDGCRWGDLGRDNNWDSARVQVVASPLKGKQTSWFWAYIRCLRSISTCVTHVGLSFLNESSFCVHVCLRLCVGTVYCDKQRNVTGVQLPRRSGQLSDKHWNGMHSVYRGYQTKMPCFDVECNHQRLL